MLPISILHLILFVELKGNESSSFRLLSPIKTHGHVDVALAFVRLRAIVESWKNRFYGICYKCIQPKMVKGGDQDCL